MKGIMAVHPKIRQEVKRDIVEQVAKDVTDKISELKFTLGNELVSIRGVLTDIRNDQSTGFMQLCQLINNLNTTLTKIDLKFDKSTDLLEKIERKLK
jgi:hypothetical protein